MNVVSFQRSVGAMSPAPYPPDYNKRQIHTKDFRPFVCSSVSNMGGLKGHGLIHYARGYYGLCFVLFCFLLVGTAVAVG